MKPNAHRLIVVGDSEVADPLLHVIDVLEYPQVMRAGEDLPSDLEAKDHVVVAVADPRIARRLVERSVLAGCAYIGVVGTRAAALVSEVHGGSRLDESLARVRAPAGLELGSLTAGEIAIAIAAELVQARRGTLQPRSGHGWN